MLAGPGVRFRLLMESVRRVYDRSIPAAFMTNVRPRARTARRCQFSDVQLIPSPRARPYRSLPRQNAPRNGSAFQTRRSRQLRHGRSAAARSPTFSSTSIHAKTEIPS